MLGADLRLSLSLRLVFSVAGAGDGGGDCARQPDQRCPLQPGPRQPKGAPLPLPLARTRKLAKTYRRAALCPQPRAKASGKVVSKGKAAPAVTATVASSGIPAPGSKLPASKLSQPGAAKAGKAKPTPRQAAEAVSDHIALVFVLCVFAGRAV